MNVPFDWKVFSFTAGVTLATGVLFGIAPAWAATRAEIGTALKEGGKSATRRRKGLSGKAIVAFQIALSTLLVVGAGLFLRTLVNLNFHRSGLSHRPSRVVRHQSTKQAVTRCPKDIALHVQIEEALRALPAVKGDADRYFHCWQTRSRCRRSIWKELRGEDKRGETKSMVATVGQDFRRNGHSRLSLGEASPLQDTETPRQVSVINQALAKKFFPNQNPIGRRFSMDDTSEKDRQWLEIVGICADTRYAHSRRAAATTLRPVPAVENFAELPTSFERQMKPEVITPSLRAAVQKIDPQSSIDGHTHQQQQIDATMQQKRMFASLTLGFGVLALASLAGYLRIMAYTVSQRTNEIGLRLAWCERSQGVAWSARYRPAGLSGHHCAGRSA